MSGWYWLVVAVVFLAALLAVHLSVSLSYDENGVRAAARFGKITLFSYPAEKKRKPKQGKKKPKKPKPEQEKKEEPKKGGKLPELRELISIIGDALGKLKRKLLVNELVLWYCSAAEDPFSAAMAFGGASAAAGLLVAPLDRAFRIKKRDIRTAVSFTDPEPTVVLRLTLSLMLIDIFSIALPAGLRFLRSMRKKKKEQVRSENGQRDNNTEE